MLIISKIGGSACTNKKEFETLNEKGLTDIASSIRRVLETRNDIQLILVHGAGSFGHFQAKQFGVHIGTSYFEDLEPRNPIFEGLAKTRNSVRKLNLAIHEYLKKEDLVSMTIDLPLELTKDELPTYFKQISSNLNYLLRNGIIPIFHGDALFHPDKVTTVISGDDILLHLCNVMNANRGIFICSVKGVYEESTKYDIEPQVIPKLKRKVKVKFNDLFYNEINVTDVTGGMTGKLSCAYNAIDLIRINKNNDLIKSDLIGINEIGTEMKRTESTTIEDTTINKNIFKMFIVGNEPHNIYGVMTCSDPLESGYLCTEIL